MSDWEKNNKRDPEAITAIIIVVALGLLAIGVLVWGIAR